MRILLIHSDYIKFEAKKKAIKDAEEFKEKEKEAENVLVAFIAVEKIDEEDPDSVVRQVVEEIKGTVKRVGAESIAIYPYAHLSSSLSSVNVARKILDDAYKDLKKEYLTIKAPFGWYKGFEIKCKGHPLSELSRTIVPEGRKGEEKKKKRGRNRRH